MRSEEINAGSRTERDARSGDSADILQGIREPGVSERIECPVFHSDWVSLRLICTYSGRGTQYVLDRGVNRGALCCPLATPAQTNAAIVRDPSALRRMAPFEVGLFKGNTYPGQEGRGVVHRSPHPGSARRLKLIVDSTEPMT